MKTNTRIHSTPVHTYEGARADRGTALTQFRRVISTCLLFENTFYQTGQSVAAMIAEVADKLTMDQLISEAIAAKDLGLRHAPLYAVLQLTRRFKGAQVGDAITNVIRRADELSEIIAMYWRDGGKPLSKQLKRGVANAFGKFNEYGLAKYKGTKNSVTLQDTIRLVRPKPPKGDMARSELYRKIAHDELEAPDTWEVALSAGADKKATWERLIREDKLGGLALLRNLSGMERAGVDRELVQTALERMNTKGIFPYQFVVAWRNAPGFARWIETAMLKKTAESKKLDGTTIVLVDVSGSMDAQMSNKGESTYMDAAAALATELCERSQDCRVFTFSNAIKEVPNTHGFGLIEAIRRSQMHGGTEMGKAVASLANISRDNRLVVLTDEQSSDRLPDAVTFKRGYIVNVAPYQYGIHADHKWTKVNGFSAGLVDWLIHEEAAPLFVD